MLGLEGVIGGCSLFCSLRGWDMIRKYVLYDSILILSIFNLRR